LLSAFVVGPELERAQAVLYRIAPSARALRRNRSGRPRWADTGKAGIGGGVDNKSQTYHGVWHRDRYGGAWSVGLTARLRLTNSSAKGMATPNRSANAAPIAVSTRRSANETSNAFLLKSATQEEDDQRWAGRRHVPTASPYGDHRRNRGNEDDGKCELRRASPDYEAGRSDAGEGRRHSADRPAGEQSGLWSHDEHCRRGGPRDVGEVEQVPERQTNACGGGKQERVQVGGATGVRSIQI
jgi:hypothetical protein